MLFKNLHVIETTNRTTIANDLLNSGATGFHFCNGVYSGPAERIVPTTLAGFQFIGEKKAKADDAFAIAFNTDASVEILMNAKNASAAERAAQEPQSVRFNKIATPLALQNPDRTIFVTFYDEEKPIEFYGHLGQEQLPLHTLHKWGYGTDPKAAKIEGAGNFREVLAFPLPNDIKPVAYDITAAEDQSSFVRVFKLTAEGGVHGAPYLSPDGKVLFPVPESLAAYRAVISAPGGNAPAPGGLG